MFKKTLLTISLFSILLVFSNAEESEYMHEVEELSPIIQCDEKYNECAEKCGDSSPNACIKQCQFAADQCYNNALSDTDDESESTETDVE